MSSAFGTAVVIVNVRAGRYGRDPSRLGTLLREAGIECLIRGTEHRGHAVELARDAVAEGHSFLVAVGGDGTIQEVVNGMMDETGPRNPDAVLGILSAGSGSDFVRTFGLPRHPAQAIANLSGDAVVDVDLGRLTCAVDGRTEVRWFANIAEAGFGAELVKRAERLPRRLGRGRYLVGFGLTMSAFSREEARMRLDDGPAVATQLTDLIVANAQFFGGGMRIAPGADPADGLFDVLVVKGTKWDYVAALGKLYRGRHLPSPAIDQYAARRVEVATDVPILVEADGELLGTTPVVFDIAERILRLKV
jgi:YegS/Rv2252/BmrU family lipid kinase